MSVCHLSMIAVYARIELHKIYNSIGCSALQRFYQYGGDMWFYQSDYCAGCILSAQQWMHFRVLSVRLDKLAVKTSVSENGEWLP